MKHLPNTPSNHGPHVKPTLLNPKPVMHYDNAGASREEITASVRDLSIVYQWTCLITNKTYTGSANNGAVRLNSYWYPSVLARKYPIYVSLLLYGHANHSLTILEVLGPSSSVSKEDLLAREQHYLDLLFTYYATRALNVLLEAGTTLGFKHSVD